MFQIDPSIFEAAQLVVRPFTEELSDFWKYVRATCLGALVITIMLWLFAYMASEQSFARAKSILNITGWFTLIVFIFAYVALVVESYYTAKERHEEKLRKIREF